MKIELQGVWERVSVPALAKAGMALSQLSGLDFSVTETDIIASQWAAVKKKMVDKNPNPGYAVRLGAHGLFFAQIMLLFSDQNGQQLVSRMIGETVALPLDDLGLSALGEVGNVVGTAFLNVFADLFQGVWEPTVPEVLTTDALKFLSGVHDDTPILVTEAVFQVTGENIDSQIIVIPLPNEQGGIA